MNHEKTIAELVQDTESTLREHVGTDITDDLVFNGFKTDSTSEEARVTLFITAKSAFDDGDDSTDAFQDANGIEETFSFLKGLGLTSDHRIRFGF